MTPLGLRFEAQRCLENPGRFNVGADRKTEPGNGARESVLHSCWRQMIRALLVADQDGLPRFGALRAFLLGKGGGYMQRGPYPLAHEPGKVR